METWSIITQGHFSMHHITTTTLNFFPVLGKLFLFDSFNYMAYDAEHA